nr:choice-of-anchor V domain-containing protein [Haliea sp. SAOS-164]
MHASQNGRNGFSGNPDINNGATCAVCHAPAAGVPAPQVTLAGPGQIDAGTTAAFTVTLSGGPAQTGGVNISVSDPAGALAPLDGDLGLIMGELAHSAPQAFSGGVLSFDFEWTAPDYNGDFTLYAAGNSSNGQLDLLGDAIGTAALAVTVVNGDPPPPPPPPPPAAAIALETWTTGLDQPVAIAHAGDTRLFLVEQPGRIRLVDAAGNLAPAPFLDIRDRVDNGASELGLLGLAFHPGYSTNGWFFVYYTTRDAGSGQLRSRVSRFSVGASPDAADPASESVLLEFAQPFSNHNAGDLHFGPDGYLYIASGDGGSGGDPQNNAQAGDRLLGKLLRIDVDASGAADCSLVAGPYGIPAGNAFVDGPGGAGCDEIYALGARNPWRFSFDRADGSLWIADVGQGAVEEIDVIPAGAAGGLNLGWRCYEGDQPFNGIGCAAPGSYLFPLHTLSHADGNCSITGGFVYRGSAYPVLQGRYFFSDFCLTSIRTLDGAGPGAEASEVLPAGQISAPAAFGEDVAGELYVASLSDGILYRIAAVPAPGDLDNDGDVDIDDLLALLPNIGEPASGADDPADLDDSGDITRRDALLLIRACSEPRCARG